MSLARRSAGAGYRYLPKRTARGDCLRDTGTPLTSYYGHPSFVLELAASLDVRIV